MAWVKPQEGFPRDIKSIDINDAGGPNSRIFCDDAPDRVLGVYPDAKALEVVALFEDWLQCGAKGVYIFPEE